MPFDTRWNQTVITTDAWVIHPADSHVNNANNANNAGNAANGEGAPRATLLRETFSFSDLEPDEVLVEPLYGSWEANLEHALARQPIDLCKVRGEDSIIIGNLGVVRVLRTGTRAGRVREGDICLVIPIDKRDRYGYPILVYAYDAPGTIGLLAKQTKLREDLLLPLPSHSTYPLTRWAAYARYFTAWDNWRVAHAAWKIQMDDSDPSEHLVFAWGGGVSFAELRLAQRSGFRVAMAASTDQRLASILANDIIPVDRREFPDLNFTEDIASDPVSVQRYRLSEKKFLAIIEELSGGAGVAIFIDNIGLPLYKATTKALGRQGVLATVGWKHGMRIYQLRASECINRHIHVNTHVWRYSDSRQIRDYQETTEWLPDIDEDAIYDFDEIPALAHDYAAQKIDSYFPLFKVNDLSDERL